MSWLRFLPSLPGTARVISLVTCLAPIPAARAEVPEPGGPVICEPVLPSPNTRAPPTPSILPSDSVPTGPCCYGDSASDSVQGDGTMELELLAGLAEAGTGDWEGSRKDQGWGMGLSVSASPSSSICVCTCMLMCVDSNGLPFGAEAWFPRAAQC